MKSKQVEAPLLSPSRTRTLSADLAASILYREMQLDSRLSVETVHSLVDLYSRAMEDFEANKDPRYLELQDRMHRMLTRPDVFKLMQVHNHCLPSEPPQIAPQRKFDRILLTISDSSRSVGIKAQRDLESQDHTLARKLSLRRHARFCKTQCLSSEASSVSTADNKLFDLDVSGMSEERMGRFEDRLEQVMERHFAEKAQRLAEIHIKYQAEIAEVQALGTLGQQVVQQMKLAMQREIDQVVHEIDSRRKEEVNKLKRVL